MRPSGRVESASAGGCTAEMTGPRMKTVLKGAQVGSTTARAGIFQLHLKAIHLATEGVALDGDMHQIQQGLIKAICIWKGR